MSYAEKLRSLGINIRRNSGNEKTQCPWCSNDRRNKKDMCLSVQIDEGVYNCHHCGKKGTVAIFNRPEPKPYIRPVWQNNTALSDKLVKYFADRGISQRILQQANVSEGAEFMPQKGKECNTVQFPYVRGGEIVNVKYRTGDKAFKMVSGAELIFYNLDAIAESEQVVITEGEIDALSYVQADVTHSISVPNGASKGRNNLQYLDNCIEFFENKTAIYIAVDNDEPGLALREELSRRLGAERCYVVDFKECKDANEYLVKHGAIALAETITAAKPCRIEGVIMVDDLYEAVVDLYRKGLPKGDVTGMFEIDHLISFMAGQLTTVTGIPNHGKSDMVDFIILMLAVYRGWKFAMFSPENFPIPLHISKLAEKLIGKAFGFYGNQNDRMTFSDLNAATEFINEHFFFVQPPDDNFSLENILNITKMLVSRYGINGLLIDPWNKLEHEQTPGVSETNYISKQLDRLITFDRRNMVHTFLVVHPRKVPKDKNTGVYEVPTLYDINGSANFYNKTDNGMTVFRDFDTNRTTLYVQKIKFRHMGKVGQASFNYDLTCGRYTPVASAQHDKKSWIKLPHEEQAELLIGAEPKQESALQPNTSFIIQSTDDMPF